MRVNIAKMNTGGVLCFEWLDFLWVSLGVLGEGVELNASGGHGTAFQGTGPPPTGGLLCPHTITPASVWAHLWVCTLQTHPSLN